jgi:hypothetical protein
VTAPLPCPCLPPCPLLMARSRSRRDPRNPNPGRPVASGRTALASGKKTPRVRSRDPLTVIGLPPVWQISSITLSGKSHSGRHFDGPKVANGLAVGPRWHHPIIRSRLADAVRTN